MSEPAGLVPFAARPSFASQVKQAWATVESPRMRTLRTVVELREALAPARRESRTIGLVPTMGALHDGHLSLIRRAARDCDVVVVSLFVNPAQFNEGADLDSYPRRERRDGELAGEAGADLLFAPPVEEVYPAGFSTAVEVLGVTERMEGASRGAEHFRHDRAAPCQDHPVVRRAGRLAQPEATRDDIGPRLLLTDSFDERSELPLLDRRRRETPVEGPGLLSRTG